LTEFRKLEGSAEADGVRVEKYRFVEKRLITRGIPSGEGSFHYVAEATDIYQLCIVLTGGSILLEPDPKVVEQYQPYVIQPSVRADGVAHDMDWYCPVRT
jgi:hypothetical protein